LTPCVQARHNLESGWSLVVCMHPHPQDGIEPHDIEPGAGVQNHWCNVKSKISANGRPEDQEDQGMSLHTQNFQSKGWQEEKMMWRALLFMF
jgi:hypothetical protein